MAKRNIDMVSPNRAQGPQYPPMVRQSSLYNLTFDEVQSQLGNTVKPLHSLNYDELQKNVIPAESGQLVQDPSSHHHHHSFILGNIGLNGSLKSNISEPWRGIVHQEQVNRSMDTTPLQQQSILGETTLENLLRSGVNVINVNDQDNNVNAIGDSQTLMGIEPMVMPSQQEHWLQMQIPSINNMHQHHEQQQLQHQQIIGTCPQFNVSKNFYDNQVIEIGYSENSMGISMSSPPYSDCKSALFGKNRSSDDMLEKTIERRQRRMAKNRESAARSRAKKQEHINRLEKEKCRLQKMNSCLKKIKVEEHIHYSNKAKDVHRSGAIECLRYRNWIQCYFQLQQALKDTN